MHRVISSLRAQALAGVCLTALSAGAASAQSAGAPITPPSEGAAGAQAAGAAPAVPTPGEAAIGATPAAPTSTFDEIIVTAQRRSENIRDVPISVTAQTGAQLAQQGVTNTQDLTQVVPGLKIDRVGAYTAPAIRGISTQLTNPGNDANVAIYLDGVYQPSQAANTFDLPDISRVEVLKGPQGTLFGRNATGGAIQIFTLDPSFKTTGQIGATYGSFNDRSFKGFISGPIIADKLAGSLSAYYDKNDGYYHNLITDDSDGATESLNFRGKLLAQLTDNLKVVATAFYAKRKDASDAIGTALNGNSIANPTPPIPGAVVPTKPGDVAYNGNPINDLKTYGGSVRASLDESFGTFTATVATANIEDTIIVDADYAFTPAGGLNYHLNQPDRMYSGELNFASRKFGGFSFVTGVFAYSDHSSYNPIQVSQDLAIPGPGTYAVSIFGAQRATSYAAYFEGNYDISDRLTVIGGLRYSYERRALNGIAAFGLVDQAPGPFYQYDKHHWNSLTPRASVRYKLTDLTNVYFTYTQGFKSGAYNVSSIPFAPPPGGKVNPPVDPEKVNAFEGGVKTVLFDRLSLNAAAFYYNYKDQQVNAYQKINGADFSVLTNAAAAHIYGAEADADLRVNESLTARAGLSLLHARYSSFPTATLEVPTGAGGNAEQSVDVTGNTLIRSPNWTLTLAADYKKKMEAGTLFASVNMYHSDKLYFEVGDRIAQPQYTTFGARLGWEFGESGLKVTAWGKNLTDRTIIQGAFITRAADGLAYFPGRSGGVTVDYSF